LNESPKSVYCCWTIFTDVENQVSGRHGYDKFALLCIHQWLPTVMKRQPARIERLSNYVADLIVPRNFGDI